MSGSGGVSIARTAIRGENRFYNPPPMRRMQQEAQLHQMREKEMQRREHDEVVVKERRTPEVVTTGLGAAVPPANKNRVASVSEVSRSSESSGSGRVVNSASNLDRFLEHTTPVVTGRCFPKRVHEPESHPYFVLEDLWESFAEWSVYGAGVPLLLNGSDSVVQYYVPYLSVLQLYKDPTKSTSHTLSNVRPGKLPDLLNGLSLRDQSSDIGSQTNESEIRNPSGQLIFEYFEHDPPFGREPLANKVSALALRFPELMTYRTCDLAPSSWMSVAWYPIYRIPSQCAGAVDQTGLSVKLPLPTFGLASYKLKASIWNPNGTQQSPKVNSLLQASGDWLKRLRVNHPDYTFFVSHSPSMR